MSAEVRNVAGRGAREAAGARAIRHGKEAVKSAASRGQRTARAVPAPVAVRAFKAVFVVPPGRKAVCGPVVRDDVCAPWLRRIPLCPDTAQRVRSAERRMRVIDHPRMRPR